MASASRTNTSTRSKQNCSKKCRAKRGLGDANRMRDSPLLPWAVLFGRFGFFLDQLKSKFQLLNDFVHFSVFSVLGTFRTNLEVSFFTFGCVFCRFPIFCFLT